MAVPNPDLAALEPLEAHDLIAFRRCCWADALLAEDTEDSWLEVVNVWAEHLLDADPFEYTQPPIITVSKDDPDAPPWAAPMVAQETGPRTDTLAKRIAAGFYPWRSGDRGPGGIGRVYIVWRRQMNGSDLQDGLAIYDPYAVDEPEPKRDDPPEANVPWTSAVWDTEARQQLFRILTVMERHQGRIAA